MEEFPDMLKDEVTEDVIDVIKNIITVQYSQITGKCPNGHECCMKAECWFDKPKEEINDESKGKESDK